jgi:hypothetical protein
MKGAHEAPKMAYSVRGGSKYQSKAVFLVFARLNLTTSRSQPRDMHCTAILIKPLNEHPRSCLALTHK